jgi:hypothetical protein
MILREGRKLIHLRTELLGAFLIMSVLVSDWAHSATLVVDSFTMGEFDIPDPQTSAQDSISSPIADTRIVSVIRPPSDPRVSARASLTSGSGTVTFVANTGGVILPTPRYFQITYTDSEFHSLLGCSAFSIEVSDLQGIGELIVRLGNDDNVTPSDHRVPIAGTGELVVPFSELNYGANGSLDSFRTMHFQFRGLTEEFSISVDEIRVIPEPSSTVYGLVSTLLLWRRRRRGEIDGLN